MPHGTRTEPKADAGGGTQTSSWQAPTDVEQALYDAKSRDDWPAYFDALADTWLYYATPRGGSTSSVRGRTNTARSVRSGSAPRCTVPWRTVWRAAR
jgi:hypothetical protein